MVIFGEEQLDPIISGGDEIGLFIMGNHHPGNHVVPQGNREGIRIRHIKENAGVTQNNPHADRSASEFPQGVEIERRGAISPIASRASLPSKLQ